MTAATISQWARRYVLTSVLFLVAWQVGVVIGILRHTEVILGLYGFVLHMIFGKAYSLVPVYFNRKLEFSHAPVVQFPFVVAGTGGFIGMSLQIGPSWLGSVGAILWSLGVSVFLGTLLWTIRSNLRRLENEIQQLLMRTSPKDHRPNQEMAQTVYDQSENVCDNK